jgi:hypothetical protein
MRRWPDQCGLVELVATLLAEHGTPEQQARYLAPLLRAERRCAYADHRGAGRLGRRRPADHRDRHRRGLAAHGRKTVDPQRAGGRFRVVLARTAPDLGRAA